MPISVLCVIALLAFGCWNIGNQNKDTDIKVAVMHMNENNDMTVIDQNMWPPQGTDILVLPEYSAILKYKDYKKMLSHLSKDGVAVTSLGEGRSPAGTNRIFYLNRDGEIVNSQDKTFLIPTGEYLPYLLQLGFRLTGKGQTIEDFRYTQQLSRGGSPEAPYMTTGNVTIGALACSGVSALNEYSRLTKSGADILTNSASLAFLLPESMYHVYAHNMARFQAVSNNRPFLQASRSGQSYIINNQGRFITQSNGQQEQLMAVTIKI